MTNMLGKLTHFFLGETDEEVNEGMSGMNNILYEHEEDDWIIVNIQVEYPVARLEVSPLEDQLIEHPRSNNRGSDEATALTEKLEGLRAVPVAHYIPRRMSILFRDCGMVHTNQMRIVQRAKSYAERRKLSRNQLLRQNRARKQHSTKENSARYFKQPRQRISRYSWQ
ncbi:uncharacterized protein si:ch211-260e23.9 [Rhincodon typus]|uniref:uncharacterized protein si:ch211-260e23.9 n=1 Tax=Rhincodon typus TaxID=259920 RepID=UPI002030714B|nr:uncharacterized protein si:ch211-260e23.9 [Rhincodon typus]XP_048462094.1 uncharacterized protein si:ch211-260e23.9 [Rhincodon typus]